MLSVEKHGSSGRTYEEDDEEVVTKSITQVSFQVDATVPLSVEVLVVCTDIATTTVSATFRNSFGMQAVGCVASSSGGLQSSLYYHADSKLLLAVNEKDVPAENCSAWICAIMSLKPTFVLSLGMMNVSQFFGERDYEAGMLRKLESSSHSSYWSKFGNTLTKVRSLEAGSVVTGVCAGLLTYCEARCIPSLLLLTITPAAVSVASLKVFETVWPAFRMFSERELAKPSNRDYVQAVKLNPFLSTTENMYC